MTEQEKREKVIKGLKSYVDALAYAEKMMAEGRVISTDPQVRGDRIRLLCDAIALLKAQEPVEPTLRGGIGGYWYCGACDYQISRGDKYCRYCGQAVKWE